MSTEPSSSSPNQNQPGNLKEKNEAGNGGSPDRLWRIGITVIEQLFIYLDTPFKYLFGRDIFISYSRADSSKYAPNLANELRAQIPKLSLYLDRWIAPPSGKLPGSLIRHLRWSSLLVVVGTEKAITSNSVKYEIGRFAKTGRPVIPISVAGEWEKVNQDEAPWAEVRGAFTE